MNKNLNLYMTHPYTEALGPYKRYAIWVQGCNKNCRGCLALDARNVNHGELVSIEILANEIINATNIEGITISGGEPFLQQDALCELICLVRKRKDIGVIIYTGMFYDEIKDTLLAKSADIIIDGEYIEELNDNKSLRGSSNQNVICLTNRYKDIINDYYGNNGRKIEMQIKGNKIMMVGIPPKL